MAGGRLRGAFRHGSVRTERKVCKSVAGAFSDRPQLRSRNLFWTTRTRWPDSKSPTPRCCCVRARCCCVRAVMLAQLVRNRESEGLAAPMGCRTSHRPLASGAGQRPLSPWGCMRGARFGGSGRPGRLGDRALLSERRGGGGAHWSGAGLGLAALGAGRASVSPAWPDASEPYFEVPGGPGSHCVAQLRALGSRSRSRAGRPLYWPAPDRLQIGPGSTSCHTQIGPGLTPDRPQIDLRSTADQPRMGPGWDPDLPRIDLRIGSDSAPDRPRISAQYRIRRGRRRWVGQRSCA